MKMFCGNCELDQGPVQNMRQVQLRKSEYESKSDRHIFHCPECNHVIRVVLTAKDES